MTPLKHFLVFGICVAAVVVLAQTALGATKPLSRVASFEPVRQTALSFSPVRLRVQMVPAARTRPARHSAKVAAPVSFHAALVSPAKVSPMKARFRPMLPVAKVRPGVG
jgi:hypothetical protein